MDGGFTAMGDIAGVLARDEYRLIGGVAVLLHVRRLQLDLPLADGPGCGPFSPTWLRSPPDPDEVSGGVSYPVAMM